MVYVLVDDASGGVLTYGGSSPTAGPGQTGFQLSDAELPKFDQPGSKTLDRPSRTIVVTPPPPPPPPPDYTALRAKVLGLALSAVGVAIDQTTPAQRLALVAVLLYRAGAVDPQTMLVNPLARWAFDPPNRVI